MNWNDDAGKIIAKINAFCPTPGCWFELNGARIKIIKAKQVISKGMPGKILDDKLTIACKEQSIKILEIQKEGKNKQAIDQFLLGNKIKQGEKIM